MKKYTNTLQLEKDWSKELWQKEYTQHNIKINSFLSNKTFVVYTY